MPVFRCINFVHAIYHRRVTIISRSKFGYFLSNVATEIAKLRTGSKKRNSTLHLGGPSTTDTTPSNRPGRSTQSQVLFLPSTLRWLGWRTATMIGIIIVVLARSINDIFNQLKRDVLVRVTPPIGGQKYTTYIKYMVKGVRLLIKRMLIVISEASSGKLTYIWILGTNSLPAA